MANPLPDEDKIYEKIKQENVKVHPLVWELIKHHIGNDVFAINAIVGSTVLDGDVLKPEDAKRLLNHTHNIQDFLDKLKKAIKIET